MLIAEGNIDHCLIHWMNNAETRQLGSKAAVKNSTPNELSMVTDRMQLIPPSCQWGINPQN